MNRYQEPIKKALENFCREYTGRDTGWRVETWLHPITKSVQAVIVMPEFGSLPTTQRQVAIWDYLEAHLPETHQVHLGLTLAMTPEEYEREVLAAAAPTFSLVGG